MSYGYPQGAGYFQQPQQQPYGQPSYGQPLYGQPPPQQPYGAPPNQYGVPPPPPGYYPPQGLCGPAGQQYQQGYAVPPPVPPHPYGTPSPVPASFGSPYPAPYGAPPPSGQYGQGPPPQGYGQPYGQPSTASYPTTPPSIGYGPPQMIQWNGDADAHELRRAMKGFGTDNKMLIRILANKDPLQVRIIADAFQRLHRRNLESDIKSETSGWFQEGLVQLVRGPLMNDVHLLYNAINGPGTKERVLNDILLGRSNADMVAIKSAYQRTFRQRLEDAVKSDLSMKTERHFMILLQAVRAEDSAPVIEQDIEKDATDLYSATESKIGTDEIKVCSILSTRNDNQIRAINERYQRNYARPLELVIKKEFSGHMEDALLYQLRHAIDKYMHHAQLLEDAMAGLGTKDMLLVSRIVRSHWDWGNMQNVVGAYEARFRRSLASKIKSETSGSYETLMLACIGATRV